MTQRKWMVKADLLYDGRGKQSDMTVVIQEKHIIDVTGKKIKADVCGIVTPAFIDAHSHIGMERQAEPAQESETDDRLKPFAPLHNPVDSIYFDDRAFCEALDFGVLYSCVVPGSGNIMGGQAVVIKNFAKNRKSAIVKEYGFKMALGYNSRAVTHWKGSRPSTRMGTAALIENYFSDVLRKEEQAGIKKQTALLKLKKERAGAGFSECDTDQRARLIQQEYDIALSNEQWAVFRLINGEKTAKVHVHKEDDALFLIDLKNRYNMNITAEHACDIFHTEIFNDLADNDIPVVYGPLGSFDYKVELKNASYKHVSKLMASKAKFGLMTDHPVVLAHHLRDSLKYFLIAGMSPEQAISLITLKNARILGLADSLGTIEQGMLASFVVWDKDPFYMGAYPLMVVAEGEIIRDSR